MRYYDPKNKQLIYIKEAASPDYWDRHWDISNLRHDITRKKFDLLVVPNTKKYLSEGSKILEGGCGTGVHVYNLNQHGFKCTGIDLAPETVAAIKRAVPEMDVRLGNVFALPFPDHYFDGYWSIGVIEHFWDGYDGIAREMNRVLRPGGYLFLTFPYMSPLRRLKARLKMYPFLIQKGSFASAQDDLSEQAQPSQFYQFALDHKNVAKKFEQHGFKLMDTSPFDGFNGLKNEISSLGFALNPIARGKSKLTKATKLAIYKTCQSFAGHSILLVFKKR